MPLLKRAWRPPLIPIAARDQSRWLLLKKACRPPLPDGRGSVPACNRAIAFLSRAGEQAVLGLFQRPARVCLLVLAAGPLLAQHNFNPGEVEDGRRVFLANCVVCHGPEGASVPGADIGHGKFRRAASDDDLVKIITAGIPGTAMPPHSLREFQAKAVVVYLHFMASSASDAASSRGDAGRGKAIFEGKGGCLACHRVQGNGSRLGPNLTDIGGRRRFVELERSVLDPDAEIQPQNRFVRVVTREGAAVTGRLLNQDAFTVQLFDSGERL